MQFGMHEPCNLCHFSCSHWGQCNLRCLATPGWSTWKGLSSYNRCLHLECVTFHPNGVGGTDATRGCQWLSWATSIRSNSVQERFDFAPKPILCQFRWRKRVTARFLTVRHTLLFTSAWCIPCHRKRVKMPCLIPFRSPRLLQAHPSCLSQGRTVSTASKHHGDTVVSSSVCSRQFCNGMNTIVHMTLWFIDSVDGLSWWIAVIITASVIHTMSIAGTADCWWSSSLLVWVARTQTTCGSKLSKQRIYPWWSRMHCITWS